MKRRITFIAAALFMLLAHNAIAQEQEEIHKDVREFFEDSSPALLFSIDRLTLTSWEGGIGIMIPGNERFQWRFGLYPSLRSSQEEWDNEDSTSTRTDESSHLIGLSVAPLWVIGEKGRLIMTLGPEIRYSLGYTSSRHRKISHGLKSMDSENKTWSHSLRAGFRFGVGMVVTSSLFIHAEYGLAGNYYLSKREYPSRESEGENWTIQHDVGFSLGVRL